MGIDWRYSLKDTYLKIREWGFDAADANLNALLPKARVLRRDIPKLLVNGGKDCMALFQPWADAAKNAGIENAQAHRFPAGCRL